MAKEKEVSVPIEFWEHCRLSLDVVRDFTKSTNILTEAARRRLATWRRQEEKLLGDVRARARRQMLRRVK